MGLYNSSGQIRITIVDGNSYTGAQAPDGSYYAVLNDGTTLTGIRHRSGALNAIELSEPPLSIQAPNGSLYVVEVGSEYTLYQGGTFPEVDPEDTFGIMDFSLASGINTGLLVLLEDI